MHIICMKCQNLFSDKNKKNIINCSSAELAQIVVKVKLTDITFPRADNDLLILAPSFSLSPVAPVLSALSDPVIKIRD